MKSDHFLIIGSGEATNEEEWKDGLVEEGSILQEFFKLFRVKKNYCARCKIKLDRREDGIKWCPNCGSTLSNDGSLIAPE